MSLGIRPTPPGFQQRAVQHRTARAASMGRQGRKHAVHAVEPHIQQLVEACSGQLEAVRASKLTSLWAGYGHILEVAAKDESGQEHSLIVKEVAPPPHESGVGHDRKLHSYQVEAYFYQALAPRLADNPVCHVPHPLLVQSSLSSGGGAMALVLSDLRPQFPRHAGSLDLAHTKAVLAWLAAFHAAFWEESHADLWPEGCYWMLDTRQEEYEAMGSEWRDLQRVAYEIDRRLKGGQIDGSVSSKFRTLVHGDVKSANILFSDARQQGQLQCALYDLQYCGGGYGVKDVVYLLASSVDSSVLQKHEDALLQHYHQQLVGALGPERGAEYTLDIMTNHFHLALLDYVRFMAGWGFWGNVSWAKRRAREFLKDAQLELAS